MGECAMFCGGSTRATAMRYSLLILVLLSCAVFILQSEVVTEREAITLALGDHPIMQRDEDKQAKQSSPEEHIDWKSIRGDSKKKKKKIETQTGDTVETSAELVNRITNSLPSSTFENGGGLIFFLHVPKTGGTSIRFNFGPKSGIEYFFAEYRHDYEYALPYVAEALHNVRRNTVFLEVHVNTNPSLFQLRDTLKSWRATAIKNNVPIFFFTVLRDPVEFAVSYFNFFHVQTTRKMEARFEECDATVDNFLRLMRNNPQCAFLLGGDKSLFPTPQKTVPSRCYDIVHDVVRETMDWVGTTEKLDETIQILYKLTNTKPTEDFTPYNMARDGKKRLLLADLNETVLEIVLNRSSYDTALYEKLPMDYAKA